jgi:hypothetical protein
MPSERQVVVTPLTRSSIPQIVALYANLVKDISRVAGDPYFLSLDHDSTDIIILDVGFNLP